MWRRGYRRSESIGTYPAALNNITNNDLLSIDTVHGKLGETERGGKPRMAPPVQDTYFCLCPVPQLLMCFVAWLDKRIASVAQTSPYSSSEIPQSSIYGWVVPAVQLDNWQLTMSVPSCPPEIYAAQRIHSSLTSFPLFMVRQTTVNFYVSPYYKGEEKKKL